MKYHGVLEKSLRHKSCIRIIVAIYQVAYVCKACLSTIASIYEVSDVIWALMCSESESGLSNNIKFDITWRDAHFS